MAHYAQIENNKVVQVLAVNDSINDPENFLSVILGLGGIWIQTSYNTYGNIHLNDGSPIHKNFAGIGYLWDGVGFYAPQPYKSWLLNLNTYLWEAPIDKPNDGKFYQWDESKLIWKEN